MKKPIQNLLKLQELEFGDVVDGEAQAAIAALRQKIPSLVLKNYERLTDRGKKGVALVRHHVCTGCHMSIPIGDILTLVSGETFQMCDNCGRYLYLPVDEEKNLRETPAEPIAAQVVKRLKRKPVARAL
jgi:predicted  nucleic acid-binding Zn-ribbon protein